MCTRGTRLAGPWVVSEMDIESSASHQVNITLPSAPRATLSSGTRATAPMPIDATH
jgi:hypothetical protein